MKAQKEYYLHSKKVLLPDGFKEAFIHIKNGKIEAVDSRKTIKHNLNLVSYGNACILPGLIDCHVHINEPGRTEWEGFETATKAAAEGGITTIVDMPLNSSPVTTSLAAFHEKLAAAKGKLHVNVGFYGGVVPGNADEIKPLAEAGVLGFKAFLCHSGIDEFPNATQEDLDATMPTIASYGLPLLAHAELVSAHAHQFDLDHAPKSYMAWLQSRPKSWEVDAIKLMINLCRKHNCKTHIVHLSADEGIQPLARAQEEGLPITVETCPHYLVFSAEDIEDGSPLYKCAPPIREAENQDNLWDALVNGPISIVSSDHSPAPPSMKGLDDGRLREAWGGIAGLQYALPAVWTGAKWHGIPLEKVAAWMSTNVAKFLGIYDRKGSIEVGKDADFVVFDPENNCNTSAENIRHRHHISPYVDMYLLGQVVATVLAGKIIKDYDNFPYAPSGEIILNKVK